MGSFKPVKATEWQQMCMKAVRKLGGMNMLAHTLKADETALIEESLLKAVQTLAAWSETQ